jgi:hypothetical protein
VLVRVFIAVYEIPSASLVPELTDHYDERTTILSARYLFGWWGGLTMSVIAYAIFLQPDAAHPTGVLNPEGYHRYGIVSSIVMLVAILVSAIGTHRYIPILKQPPTVRPQSLRAALGEFRETVANRSFLALFVAAMFASVAGGLMAALSIYFNTYFWELTSSEIGIVVLPAYVARCSPAWSPRRRRGRSARSGRRSESRRPRSSSSVAGRSASRRLVPGEPHADGAAVADAVQPDRITLLIASNILFSSMVADVAEDSEVATGRRSEGVFTAATLFVQKATSGIGSSRRACCWERSGFRGTRRRARSIRRSCGRWGLVYVPLVQGLYVLAGIFSVVVSDRIGRRNEENLREAERPSREGLTEPRTTAIVACSLRMAPGAIGRATRPAIELLLGRSMRRRRSRSRSSSPRNDPADEQCAAAIRPECARGAKRFVDHSRQYRGRFSWGALGTVNSHAPFVVNRRWNPNPLSDREGRRHHHRNAGPGADADAHSVPNRSRAGTSRVGARSRASDSEGGTP